MMELGDFLTWIVGGGGAGLIAFWLMDHVKALRDLGAEYKRYASLILAGLLAAGAFGASVGIGYVPNPGTIQGWIEGTFSVVAVAVGLSQVVHGRLRLK
jgi:hypothetical protein